MRVYLSTLCVCNTHCCLPEKYTAKNSSQAGWLLFVLLFIVAEKERKENNTFHVCTAKRHLQQLGNSGQIRKIFEWNFVSNRIAEHESGRVRCFPLRKSRFFCFSLSVRFQFSLLPPPPSSHVITAAFVRHEKLRFPFVISRGGNGGACGGTNFLFFSNRLTIWGWLMGRSTCFPLRTKRNLINSPSKNPRPSQTLWPCPKHFLAA